MRTKTIVTVAVAIAALSAADADCQIVYNQPASSFLRFNYSKWSMDPASSPEEVISQMTVSLSGFVPIRDDFEARYQIASGHNDLRADDMKTALSGLSDLRLQFSHSFMKDRLLLSAGFNLPTGKQELDVDGERRIIEYLSHDYLSLPLRRYGEGFGFNLLAGAATEVGRFKCGMSAVYDHFGSYTPYEGVGDYDPGDAFSLTATAEIPSGRVKYAGDIGFSFFGTDALEEEDIYRQAPQFSARLQATLSGDRRSTTLGARMILRGRNKRYSLTDGTIDSQLKKYGDEFDVFLRMAFAVGSSWNLGAMVAARQILSSEEDLGKSSLLNLAADVGRNLSDHLGLDLGVMYHAGSADGGAIDVSAFQMSGGLKVIY